jgi:hypothetical protein
MACEITASYETLLDQATYTAGCYLGGAVRSIDSLFGDGYAKKNPGLVGAFMQTAVADFSAALSVIASQNVAEALRAAVFDLGDVAGSLNGIGGALGDVAGSLNGIGGALGEKGC